MPTPLKTSYKGAYFVAHQEACVLVPYQDGPHLAIGFGHNGSDVLPEDVITFEKAASLLKSDLGMREKVVNNLLQVEVNQNQFDALISFAFNKGSLVKQVIDQINLGHNDEAMAKMLSFNRNLAGQWKLGLALRRQKEVNMFVQGDYGPLENVLVFAKNPDVDPKSVPFVTEEVYNNG